MFIKGNLLLAIVLLITLGGQAQAKKAVVIEGRVVEETTGRPVSNAHVYIVDGEEETLTNSNGEFSLETWQKLPLTLTVDTYKRYKKLSILISDPTRKQLVRLKFQSR